MPMTLVEQLADSLNMYVEEIEGFTQARYGTTHWTNDLRWRCGQTWTARCAYGPSLRCGGPAATPIPVPARRSCGSAASPTAGYRHTGGVLRP